MQRIALAIVVSAIGVSAAGCGGPTFATREFRIPSSSMEPTLNCAMPAPGCLSTASDHVIVDVGKSVQRGDIIALQTPPSAAAECGEGGIFVKRIIGLPGETLSEDDKGFISGDGRRLNETYVSARARALDTGHYHQHWTVPAGQYFVVGDNRSESCDSRQWGGVPRRNIIGPAVQIVRG
ncbi:MAG: signal peptidase [Gaiellaceae bacterium]|jgi:signal peptidase I|nr:signal peptidase [Gaiellaceae bacterium]